MARIPDGWVFISKWSDLKSEDGKLVATVSVDKRELVMCKNCKWWDKDLTTDGVKGFCLNTGYCKQPNFYCADGERRDEDGNA